MDRRLIRIRVGCRQLVQNGLYAGVRTFDACYAVIERHARLLRKTLKEKLLD